MRVEAVACQLVGYVLGQCRGWRQMPGGDAAIAIVPAVAHSPQQQSKQDQAHQILVMLHLPPPHFRPDANYTALTTISQVTARVAGSQKNWRTTMA